MTLLKKILAIQLTILVFLSATSFSFHTHFCSERLYSVGVMNQAKLCDCMNASNNCAGGLCPVNDMFIQHDTFCCKDLSIINEGQDTLVQTSMTKELKPHVKLLMFLPAFLNTPSDTSVEITNISKYQNLSPSLIERSIHLLVQSFLL